MSKIRFCSFSHSNWGIPFSLPTIVYIWIWRGVFLNKAGGFEQIFPLMYVLTVLYLPFSNNSWKNRIYLIPFYSNSILLVLCFYNDSCVSSGLNARIRWKSFFQRNVEKFHWIDLTLLWFLWHPSEFLWEKSTDNWYFCDAFLLLIRTFSPKMSHKCYSFIWLWISSFFSEFFSGSYMITHSSICDLVKVFFANGVDEKPVFITSLMPWTAFWAIFS